MIIVLLTAVGCEVLENFRTSVQKGEVRFEPAHWEQ